MRKFLSISTLLFIAFLSFYANASSIFKPADADILTGFKTLDKPVPTSVNNGQIEVAEVFWYGCGHCFHLEKEVQKFKQNLPKNVEFVRIPAPLNPFWETHARIYFIADALNVADKLHPLVFQEIMQNKNYLEDKLKIAEFFAKQGFDKQKVLELYDSFGINSAIANAKSKVARYKITSVPQIVVDGKYIVSSETAKGEENIFPTVRKLIEKLQKSRN